MTEPLPTLAGLAGRLVLASGSPRRRDLLALLGLQYEVVVPDVDETPRPGEQSVELVTRLAVAKAERVAAERRGSVVVAADTAIDVGGEILGKPADADEARRMLRALSGQTHLVHTAVAVANRGGVEDAASTSEVRFVELSDDDVEWYVATGEPSDKAGAYALQGIGGLFVESVHGSVSSVLGLPLDLTIRLLAGAAGSPSNG